MSVPKLIVGNWKMNGLTADSDERTAALVKNIKGMGAKSFEIVLCPPATQIARLAWQIKDTPIALGGQDCHAEVSGAFTGNVSAPMLKDIGCAYVIVGHSERRQFHKETNAEIAAKAKAAHVAGLVAIVCIGETDAERSAGKADAIVVSQLQESLPDTATAENTVVAYEPVWAIGTGKVASVDDIKHMHALIRTKVSEKVGKGAWLRLLYGGSVKSGNAPEILHLPNVDGVLVGGASLKADEFWAIAAASES